MDYRLELVQVPVSDVERAKSFYVDRAGFTLDVDIEVAGGVRFVQLTPRGSPASIAIGTGITTMRPGSLEGLQLVVTDVAAARADLAGRGVAVSDVEVYDWGSFVYFTDPDGNGWAVQQLPAED
ncbi:MAG: VOC family protein [Natronosporangium sp.]